MTWAILATALSAGCSGAPAETEGDDVARAGGVAQAIRNGTPAPANALLGMVKVSSSRGSCSGTVIAADTILTAAHCFCGQDVVGSNKCDKTATITYRRNPAGGVERQLSGVVRVHPSYNPSWIEAHYEHDIATVTVSGVSPAHVPPVSLLGSYLSEGARVSVAGFGRTGSDCSGSFGTLNSVGARIDSYEDGRDIMAFDDFVWCQGDSGGAVFDAQGRQRAVISMETPWLQKAVTTNSEFDWIKAGMCRSSRSNRCDGDGVTCDCTARKDILFQNANGALAIWAMNGDVLESQTWPGVVYSDWKIQGSGDFDGDKQADILWRHDTGQTAIWFMKDGAKIGEGYPGGQDSSLTWKIQSTGDFDADGRSDILWRHTNGQLAIWFRGDANQAAYPGYSNTPYPVDNSWQVRGTGDFNGDTRADILWQHTSGQVAIWLMSGGTRIGEANPGALPATTKLAGIGDFDGNLRSDTLWRNADGSLTVWFGTSAGSDGIAYNNTPGPGDASWSVQGVGDFDHDGREDILWRHTSGQLAIWLVLGARFNGDLYPPHVDNSWQVKTLLAQPGM
ncbi:MAG TPA: trypsin-like serine protease [Polyangiaceae bacterium]